jgi:hypothetical protein
MLKPFRVPVPSHAAGGQIAIPGAGRHQIVTFRLAGLWLVFLIGYFFSGAAMTAAEDALEAGWTNPPTNARLRAYWWWLNGNVSKKAITRDLEEMKAKGFGGALICDAGGAEQDGNDPVPHGPTFFTPAWRELYQHCLREADRLGLEMSLNILSGWNLGGPGVSADDAAKKLVWSEVVVTGPTNLEQKLTVPPSRDQYYRDLFVIAYPLAAKQPPAGPLLHWEEKSIHKSLSASAPDTSVLFEESPASPGEQDTIGADVLDLTSKLDQAGMLHWQAPPGSWQVLRFGYTIGDHSHVSTCSEGWQGYALDVLDAGAFQRYWNAIVEPLIADAGPLAGTTLKYLHTDSWEVEPLNWTPTFREEFHRRRGYDLLPYSPALTGRVVNSRNLSDRFLADFRKTLGDLAIDNHYRLFRDNAHRHGLQIHPESGGPHAVPIDAQRCLGWDDAPMSEFWAWSWRHRIGDENRFFVKQPASAAHTYGHPLVLAEGFTDIGPHWQERIWENLKPSFDHALCEGLNLLVWHAFVCSPDEMGIPGQQYFAGTHFNPNSTWWSKSGPFLSYIDRCQFLLQQGHFVADACYYYGDHVPNFAQIKRSDPARVLPGFDYDVITEEALLTRMSVSDGNLVLPDGMRYRVLVLPHRTQISLPVLRKLKQFVAAGATVVGPKPTEASGLTDYPRCDQQVAALGEELWPPEAKVVPAKPKPGSVISAATAREVLIAAGVSPDFEWRYADDTGSTPAPVEALQISGNVSAHDAHGATTIDYIHRSADGAEIYFVANRSNRAEKVMCTFRVAGKAPELWDPISGQRRLATAYREQDGRTTVALEFAPSASWFVLFRQPAVKPPATTMENWKEFTVRSELPGPWTVKFDPRWGGPPSVQFDHLVTWNSRAEPGIRYYSGTATYTIRFKAGLDPVDSKHPIWLDLGDVRELAEVRLNGRNLGIVWAPPFRVELTPALKPGTNSLEIEVVNFWPNRIIGDESLPVNQRLTRTNIRKLTQTTALMDSGLLGPVRVMQEQ